MGSTAAGAVGENDGVHSRKRSMKDHKPSDRDLPENVEEEHRRHRRHFREFERKRPERRRSRTQSPAAGNGRHRHRSSDTPPRHRSHFQHDEHCSAARVDERSVRRASEHGRWSDRTEPEDKVRSKAAPSDLEKDGKCLPQMDNNHLWKHNGYHELEAEAQVVRRRPAFRETKTKVEEVAISEIVRPPRQERPVTDFHKREEERNYGHRLGRREGIVAGVGDRVLRRADVGPRRTETPRYGHPSRERYSGPMNYRARGDYNGGQNGRNSFQSGGGFEVEKWKHDLFDDANKSPTHKKSEEEHIAKVEALLAL